MEEEPYIGLIIASWSSLTPKAEYLYFNADKLKFIHDTYHEKHGYGC